MKLVILFIGTIGILFLSCHNNEGKEAKIDRVYNDTIIKDIPEWYNASNYSQKHYKRLDSLLKLESLQEGFDSLQIRIWVECGYKASNLIVFQLKKNKWTAVFYTFKIKYKENSDFEITALSTLTRLPKSGWIRFSQIFLNTGIIDLPDGTKFLPNYNIPTDADWVLVEIGKSKKYRLYEYPELGLNSNIKDGPGKLNLALKLIETEFDYKRPCQDSTGVD